MKKVLIIATIAKHINRFHLPYIKKLKQNNYKVDSASNGKELIKEVDNQYKISFKRNPICISNIKAYFELKKLIKKEKYDVIYCHTPVGALISRFVIYSLKKENYNSKVIYMAHGFHFYKGAPLINWICYYPVEKILSKVTDMIVTINEEDYEFAKSHFKTCKTVIVNGVGINENKLKNTLINEDIEKYNKEFEINKKDYIFLNIGELNKNKNQIMLVEAARRLKRENIKFKLLIAGEGPLKEEYEHIIEKYNMSDNIKLIGYRNDIFKLIEYSNCVIATSKREGLPVNVLESMFYDKPIIATNIRGHRDLLKTSQLVNLNNIELLKEKMKLSVYENKRVEKYNIEKFKLKNVITKWYEYWNEVIYDK